MSLLSRFAGSITASFIGRVMRPLGGRSSTSIHFQSHSGSGSIVRPIASTSGRNCKADQRRCRRGRYREASLFLSVYVPSISSLLHRPKALPAPGGWLPSPTRAAIKANPDREWHLREGEAAMTEPMRDPTNPPRILTPRKPPATVALRKPPPTMPPRRPPPIIPARKPPPRRWKVVEHDVDGGVHVSF
jgi:hypothetical protein